jgi:V8-like Glu-specific endopeptidase
MTNREQFFKDLICYVEQDEAETAIQLLLSFFKGTDDWSNHETVILLSARFQRLARDMDGGTIRGEDAQIERNRINRALLNTITRLKKTLKTPTFPAAGPALPDTEVPALAYEKIIGPKSCIKKIAWLEKGLEAQKSICRIVNKIQNSMGTGFLTADGKLFTNHHVISSAQEAAHTIAQFNFNEDTEGKLLTYFSYPLDASTFYTDKALDFTCVKIRETDDLPPLSKWKHLMLTDKIPTIGDHVTIIQHPSGGPKQIALNENRVTNIYQNYLQYTTDTEPGSSGSPVFNDDWEVVGLHHAGGDLKINDNGDKRFINQAILIKNLLN